MRISVLICTYRRADRLSVLLDCLAAQTHRDMEILVLDGSGPDPTVREAIESVADKFSEPASLRVIGAETGLTPRRNIGLENAQGEIVCFLDDDLVIEDDFLALIDERFSQSDMADVGGLCAYDKLHYPASVSWRWKLRRFLGSVSTLEPGRVDRIGRCSPFSFAEPFTGCKPVGWFSGFCMIYRREAVSDVRFDEELPSYGGDDRDLSIRVGRKWRLLFCGDLHVEHRSAGTPHRSQGARRVYESAFGTGRVFAKHAKGLKDHLKIVHYVVAEMVVDVLAIVRHPSIDAIKSFLARPRGVVKGYFSFRSKSVAPEFS